MNATINKNIIARNTILLYGRSLATMVIGLYSSRVILQELGVQDFGIYNIIGGVVATFTMFNTISASIQRYITFELGTQNTNKLATVFSSSINLLLLFSFFVLIIAETIGLWFINTQMTFPPGKLFAVNVLYQISIVTFIITLLSHPYDALIAAHEHFNAYAYISIAQSVLNLILVLSLRLWLSNKLIIYAIMMLFISIVIRSTYQIYCRKQFKESSYTAKPNWPIIKEMATFSSLNFIGSIASVGKKQGVDIIINIFFGVVLNAAMGIAYKVYGTTHTFIANFTAALNPQITKLYASNNRNEMNKLIYKASTYSFYLLALIIIPLIFETQSILYLWLGNVPIYTVIFTRLLLIMMVVDTLSTFITRAIFATGNVKKYQLIVCLFTTLNVPLSYIAFRMGLEVYTALLIAILLSVISLFMRIYLLNEQTPFGFKAYFKNVSMPIIIVGTLCILPPSIIHFLTISDSVLMLIIKCCLYTLWSLIIIFLCGLNKNEKLLLIRKIKQITQHHD